MVRASCMWLALGALRLAAELVVLAPSAACGEPPSPAGAWQIKGKDDVNTTWTGLIVLTTGEDGAISGSIDWSARGGQNGGASGREIVSATFDPETRTLRMKGERLQNPNNIGLGTYEARLSEDGARLEHGKWSDAGNGTWTARRTEKEAAAEEETGFLERTYTGPKGGKFKYAVFVPHDFRKGGTKKYPVILFLHGSGEAGKDGWAQTKFGLGPAIEADEQHFPFLAVFPQAREWFGNPQDAARALAVLDEAMQEFRGDPGRQYLTGWSLGGLASWRMAADHPERWAALVPVCSGAGAPDPALAPRLKDIPCWCFHGARDEAAPVRNSRAMIRALRAAGGKPKYTEDPDAGHTYDYVNGVYGNQELHAWLLRERRQ